MTADPRPSADRPAGSSRGLRWWLLAVSSSALVLATTLAGGVISTGGWYRPLTIQAAPVSDEAPGAAAARLASLAPRGTYLVVDTYRNRLRVYRDRALDREAACSTGSGTVLRDPETGREWVFDTPRGERRIEKKVRDPVWLKPDWAFVEEGFKPPESWRDRVDDVSLGDYGLYLGDGYIIHGTLFQTLLGQRITHGCIRLGDEDLEYVYRTMPLGGRVYLF